MGEEIEVFYNPKQPSQNVMDLEFNYVHFGVFLFFLLAVLLAERLWYRYRLKLNE